jgi:CRISPR/Cas system-associated endonuclease Cas1
MPRGSSPKRERQYEHIKDSAESTQRAKEIAEARRRNIEGRSSMNKAQLARALGR